MNTSHPDKLHRQKPASTMCKHYIGFIAMQREDDG